MVQQQAAIMSFNDVFWLLMVIFLAMLPLVFLMRKAEHQDGDIAIHWRARFPSATVGLSRI
jgi:hypothetical protein